MKQSMNKKISTNLKVLLEQKNKTQRELAEYLGVSETAVSNWVKGDSVPRMDKVDSICEFLHITRMEFFGFTEADFRDETKEFLYTRLAAEEDISVNALKLAVEYAKKLKG